MKDSNSAGRIMTLFWSVDEFSENFYKTKGVHNLGSEMYTDLLCKSLCPCYWKQKLVMTFALHVFTEHAILNATQT